jgi:putative methionine-R-sulfoxide reductase with GAF domain
MASNKQDLSTKLRDIVSTTRDRVAALQAVAELLRESGNYRWVGLYDADRAAGMVRNVVWSGAGAPEYPTFPITKGLTASVISSRKTVNVGDVTTDPRYLMAFGTTRSEIIVPVLDARGEKVVGTVDVESETVNAFDADGQAALETCANVVRPLWYRMKV